MLTESGRAVLIRGAGGVVSGYDLRAGELLWTGRSQGKGVVPSAGLGAGRVICGAGFEKPAIRAFRPSGLGGVAKTHLAWGQTKGVPLASSFIYLNPHLDAMTTYGAASFLRAAPAPRGVLFGAFGVFERVPEATGEWF